MPVLLKIDEVLRRKNMLQKDLAQKLGVSKVTVSYWCNNQATPSLNTLGEIAGILRVKIADLIKD